MDQAGILILSDDRDFVDSVVRGWQNLRFSPEFAVTCSDAGCGVSGSAVVVTDCVAALGHLTAGVERAIAITNDPLPELGGGVRVVRIARDGSWADDAAALARETLLRLETLAQLAEAKQQIRGMERLATLGKFILEARHGLGNALTGVLGHSELLLLDSGAGLRNQARVQLETIHAMSLKMHETFHRLSSLELELRIAERQAEGEPHWDVQPEGRAQQ